MIKLYTQLALSFLIENTSESNFQQPQTKKGWTGHGLLLQFFPRWNPAGRTCFKTLYLIISYNIIYKKIMLHNLIYIYIYTYWDSILGKNIL